MKRSTATSIRLVTSLEEFKALGEAWSRLLREACSKSVFLTWEWLYTWTKHYLGERQLWIMLVYDDTKQLLGIAPLYIDKTVKYRIALAREVRFLGSEEVCSCYLDVIVRDKDRNTVVHALYQFLHGPGRRMWDVLCLCEIPSTSATIDVLGRVVEDDGKVHVILESSSCPVVALPERFENLLGRISPKKRANLKWQGKLLDKAGLVRHERIHSSDQCESGMSEFIRLHQMRWEQKGQGGAFDRPRFRAFHREVAQLFCERGWLRLELLSLDGVNVAGVYGFVHGGRYYYYLPGFNPDAIPQASPGALLLLRCLDHAIQEGCKEFDLLRGMAEYKLSWANEVRRTLSWRHYNKGVGPALLRLLECGKDAAKILVR